jgi:two-component system chemotaxis response regulator CheY
MKQIQILVVDDVEGIRVFISLILKSMGYENVDTAAGTEEALEKAKNNQYDIIFLDINMPPSSGLALLKDLRVCCPQSKVVICSANDSDENINTALNDGAEGFLVKPHTAVGLSGMLNRLGL